MEVKAVSRDTGISPRKMRLLVDMVKGKSVEEALNILKFAPTPNAEIVAKTIKSAAANAENPRRVANRKAQHPDTKPLGH